MMKPEEKIEQVLNSLEGMSQAKASPFWEERIVARLNDERSVQWSSKEIWAYSLSGLCALLLIANTLVITQQPNLGQTEQRTDNTFYSYE